MSSRYGADVGDDRSVEQRHVRHVREQARVFHRVVRAGPAVGPDPHELTRARGPRPEAIRQFGHISHVDRTRTVTPHGREHGRDSRSRSCSRLGSSSGSGTSGISCLMVESGLVQVKAGLEVEDRPAVLDRDHAARHEGSAVADAVHLVEDRDPGITRPQEVGVQRVHRSLVDGASGSDECLAGHLSAEHPLTVLVGLDTSEDVDLDGFDVEQIEHVVECGLGHAVVLSAA